MPPFATTSSPSPVVAAARFSASAGPFAAAEQLQFARQIVRTEGQALLDLAERLDDSFLAAVELIHHCPGGVVVSGMGKAGLVGQKIAATLSSTGCPSQFLHPAEAIHGDLGGVRPGDVLLVLSFSGESEEIVRLLPVLADFSAPLVAITGNPHSSLGRAARVTLNLGALREACPLGLAPSTSTTAMLALGDALALVVSRLRAFTREDFVRYHPGGNLGRKLAKVADCMRPLASCRVAHERLSVRQTLVETSQPGRRTGAVMLVNAAGCLTGLFTDSDLARLLEHKREDVLDRPVSEVMTRGPQTVPLGARMAEAIEILSERKFSELPVVDHAGRPQGLIDITDLAGWLPPSAAGASAHHAAGNHAAGNNTTAHPAAERAVARKAG